MGAGCHRDGSAPCPSGYACVPFVDRCYRSCETAADCPAGFGCNRDSGTCHELGAECDPDLRPAHCASDALCILTACEFRDGGPSAGDCFGLCTVQCETDEACPEGYACRAPDGLNFSCMPD